MDELTKLAEESIVKYFSNLALFGYKDYDSVYHLVTLMLIEELINGELSIYVDKEDYKTIMNALYCICGNNCIVGFPEYTVNDSLIHKSTNSLHTRISEDSILRSSQSNILRKI